MGRQVLIVNLSGDQKKVLGFASWTQVSITAAGIILGCIVFTLVKALLNAIGAGAGAAVMSGAICFVVVAGPFAYVAFRPIRDKQGNLLYYMNKQLEIDHQFARKEIGTYVNIQPSRRPINRRLSYAPKYERGEE